MPSTTSKCRLESVGWSQQHMKKNPPKFNSSPLKKWWLEDDFSFLEGNFSGANTVKLLGSYLNILEPTNHKPRFIRTHSIYEEISWVVCLDGTVCRYSVVLFAPFALGKRSPHILGDSITHVRGKKQDKCMVSLRDFPSIRHFWCWWHYGPHIPHSLCL